MRSLHLLWFALEYPFHAFSVLQSLYLIPLQATPPLLAWIPFTVHSVIQLPPSPPDASMASMLSYAGKVITHPFILAYISDRVGHYLYRRVYFALRHSVVKPDRPDRISLQSVRDSLALSAEGAFSYESTHSAPSKRRGLLPQILRDTLKPLLPAFIWLWGRVLHSQRAPLAVELSPDIEEELLVRSHIHYRDLLRHNRESDIELRRAPRTLRVMAIRAAFNDFNLDPDHSMVDIFELADEISFSAHSRTSTPTPEPEELPPAAEVMAGSGHEAHIQNEEGVTINSHDVQLEAHQPEADEERGNPHLNGAAEEDSEVLGRSSSPEVARESFQPSVTLDVLLEPVSSDTEEEPRWRRPSTPLPGFSVPHSQGPGSPVPGINRAASLPNTIPRPVRRPTDIDQDIGPAREELLNTQRPPSRLRDSEGVYRVSILSNHAAETFTNSAASIVESIVLLPLHILFVRSVARDFLSHLAGDQPTSRTAALLRDVWPLSSGFRVRDLDLPDKALFWGNFFMTIGMQGLVNFAIWATGTRITLRLGERFGWGNV